MYMKRKNKKAVVMLVSLVLLVCVTVGATLALLIDQSGPLKNIFNPSKVTTSVEETLNGNTKSNVMIANTGDTDAYIRAAVVVTFKSADGQIHAQKPVEGTDYTVSYALEADGWKKIGGIWYYKGEVDANGGETEALIKSIAPAPTSTAPTDYFLNVEIIASGIQSEPIDAVRDVWGNEAANWVSTPVSNG